MKNGNNMKSISDHINEYSKNHAQIIKDPQRFRMKWFNGNREHCENFIMKAIIELDKTISDFKWLPEYDDLVKWMQDTGGRGFSMIGATGRSKTTVVYRLIPLLLSINRKEYDVISANDLTLGTSNFVIIDEVGTEKPIFDKGRDVDVFPLFVDRLSKTGHPLFFTSNLSKDEFAKRYGEPIYNRVKQLSVIIPCNGESYWNK